VLELEKEKRQDLSPENLALLLLYTEIACSFFPPNGAFFPLDSPHYHFHFLEIPAQSRK
jgi:hypothetical protein